MKHILKTITEAVKIALLRLWILVSGQSIVIYPKETIRYHAGAINMDPHIVSRMVPREHICFKGKRGGKHHSNTSTGKPQTTKFNGTQSS